MNEKAIFEIGNIIHIRYYGSFNPFKLFRADKLTAKEIMDCYEYQHFRKHNPIICELAEH